MCRMIGVEAMGVDEVEREESESKIGERVVGRREGEEVVRL